jgi:uncharacterized protein with HEPN domain
MTKIYAPHIALIRAAVVAIEPYRPADEATFMVQPMAQDAILMRLQEIGENLARMRRIDEEVFAAAAHDSWIQLIGLRNVISHGYHTVTKERIWSMVTEELPSLAASLDVFTDSSS